MCTAILHNGVGAVEVLTRGEHGSEVLLPDQGFAKVWTLMQALACSVMDQDSAELLARSQRRANGRGRFWSFSYGFGSFW